MTSPRVVSPAELEIPAEVAEAFARMRRPPHWRQLYTVPNLDSFTNFIAFYATAEEQEELIQLPVVYHRNKWDGIATRIPIAVSVDQRWVPLPEVTCSAQNCARCLRGAGGYTFGYVDERWTPEAALDLTQTQEEMREESALPWPRGILQPPLPQNSPAPFLTSMWEFPSSPGF